MKIMGLPDDLLDLINVWLRDRSYYVCVNGQNSTLYDLLLGTVQGSVLGTVLYAIFISPLFDIEDLSAFADDNFTISAHIDLQIAKTNLEISLTNISKWMKDSGLKINESKTELCVFTRTAHQAVSITVNGTIIESKNTMNPRKWAPIKQS